MISYMEKLIFSMKELAIYRRIVGMVSIIDEYKLIEKIKGNDVTATDLAVAVGSIMKFPTFMYYSKESNQNHPFLELDNKEHLIDTYCIGRLPMVQIIDNTRSELERTEHKPQPNEEIVSELIKMMRPSGFSLSKPIRSY